MQDKYARVVHEVFGHGLDLKTRIQRGEVASMQVEQQRFIQMLNGQIELNQDPNYMGDSVNARQTSNPNRSMEPFLGIRYALACWLDEIFIAPDSPWSAAWTESTLETYLHGSSQDRGWRFWENAIKAEGRHGTDALEVYLWCVLLGFRGKPEESRITSVTKWIDKVRKGVIQGMPKEFSLPTEREAPSDVPPLRNRERYSMMVRVFFFTVLIFVGTLVVFIMKSYFKTN